MSRSLEDITQELLQLRNSDRKWATESAENRKEIKALKAELEWWRKTFGPDQFAAL